MNSSASTQIPLKQEPSAQKRGCLFYLKRGLLALVAIVVALVLLGVGFQTVAIELDRRAYSPRGQLYSVNRHQIHIVCEGEGSPAVILQTGATAESLWWYRVQAQLASHTRVCAYDRPGMGWSEPVSGSRDPLTINAELHSLLEQAGITPPYVVVGHSYGSILSRIFAGQYPEAVIGAVLVDSQLVTPKHFDSQSAVEQNQAYWDGVRTIFSLNTQVGMMRLIQSGQFQAWGYPSDLALEMNGLQSRGQVIDAYWAESGRAFPALQEASANAENLGNLPLAVLWASATYSAMQPNPTQRPLAEELSTYSSNSVTHVVEGADHGSILGNEVYAQQVTDAILDVIHAAQTGEPLAE